MGKTVWLVKRAKGEIGSCALSIMYWVVYWLRVLWKQKRRDGVVST